MLVKHAYRSICTVQQAFATGLVPHVVSTFSWPKVHDAGASTSTGGASLYMSFNLIVISAVP